MEEVNKDFRHQIPADFQKKINSATSLRVAWDDLTPLARNEWICWIISAKKEETRKNRIIRACKELKEGKRRPCCWPGCPHRMESAKKWFKLSHQK